MTLENLKSFRIAPQFERTAIGGKRPKYKRSDEFAAAFGIAGE
jgi:hypothetical protein